MGFSLDLDKVGVFSYDNTIIGKNISIKRGIFEIKVDKVENLDIIPKERKFSVL